VPDTARRTLRQVVGRWAATLGLLLKRVLIIAAFGLSGWLVFELLVVPIINDDDPVVAFILLWLVLAYVLLPRVQRALTKIYVPDYFVGRTRTADGLLGDPVNLAFDGSEQALLAGMTAGGWTRADELGLRTGARIARCTVLRRRYTAAPVSPLFLFSRKQDFAFEQEIDGNPSKRHHVRFWRCPPGWYMPGGISADWVAAGTYDRSVGLSLFTLQITHKIGERIDEERDHILTTLGEADAVESVQWVENYFSGYHSRNGGGDVISTDGNLPIVQLKEPERQS
jgi:LssY C-terminus